MTSDPSRWLAWRERLAAASEEGHDVKEVLRRVADEIAAACPRGPLPAHRWAAVGVIVREARLRGRGRCDVSVDPPVLYVNQGEKKNRYAQHFTVAHEIGHLLLSLLPPERTREVSHREEEELCDELAQRMIVPPDELAAELGGRAPTLERVLELCGTFGANPGTLLRALSHQLHFDRSAYLLAKWRGHYRRPAVLGFRIETVTGPPALYWPAHQRIAGLGLRNLARAGEEARHGAFFDGAEEKVTVKLEHVEGASRHNVMSGPVSWQAVRQGRDGPYLLALIDCSQLAGDRSESKRGDSHPSPRGTVIAGV